MKKACHIIGAGDFTPELLEINENDIVIACDGGLAPLLSAGITVDYCIGDFDSLGEIPTGDFKLTVLPKEKDVTDTHAACSLAMEMGYTTLRLYGMLGGGRFSHSVANLQLISSLAESGLDVRIIDRSCTVYALADRGIDFSENQRGYVSVFSFSEQAVCTCRGLKYEIEDHPLTSRFPLGVSNELVGCAGQVIFKKGVGIVIFEEKY